MNNKPQLEENNTDPTKYIWGIIYYNKEDKRIFPPKRNKWLGWTINFANPLSVLAFIALLAILIWVQREFFAR